MTAPVGVATAATVVVEAATGEFLVGSTETVEEDAKTFSWECFRGDGSTINKKGK